jgi:DNA ligase-1
VVAVNRENGNKLMAFQHLSTRERGTRDGGIINVQNIKVSVCVFLFDLMFANGELLVKNPLRKRRKCMQELFPNVRSGYFCYASEITVEAADAQPDSETTLQRLTSFFEEALASSCEGLMGKSLDDDATYMASKRSDSWLKVQSYVAHIS